MPTQRAPFFASFFGAFRARTSPTFQAKSASTASAIPPSISATGHGAASTTNPSAISGSRSITTSPSHTNLNNSQQQQSQTQSQSQQITPQSIPQPSSKSTSTFSATAFPSTSPNAHHSHSPFYNPRSPGTLSPNSNPLTSHGQSTPLTRGRQRRGSDSSNSSGGFMDTLGSDKWYIGGRTAGGEERFYRLGLVTAGGVGSGPGRATSLDRLSL